MTDITPKLAAAMVKAQAAMKNPGLDATNPHFRSKYASLVAVREAVIPVFNKHGISITQWPECRIEGERVMAGCTNVITHESGEQMQSTCLLPLEKANAHGAGSCITYARRYSLMAIAGVVGDEDDDANAAVAPRTVEQRIVAANIQPGAGAKEGLTASQVAKVDGIASSMLDMFEAGYPIGKIWDCSQELDTDEKVYLNTFFDSKQRAALKKHSQGNRKQATPEELATQA